MKTRQFPENYLVDLEHRIGLVLTYLRLDQKSFARMLQTSQSKLPRMESGNSASTLNQLITIKRLCDQSGFIRGDMPWAWLLEGQGHIEEMI